MSKKDIDYIAILREAKDLTLKNKRLWLLGLIIAIFGGGGGSGINFPSGNSSRLFSNNTVNLKENIPQNAQHVLGAATSALSDWFASVPVSTWILLIGVFMVLLFIGLVVGLVARNWGEAALIAGISQAQSKSEPISLSTSLPSGKRYYKSLIWSGFINSCAVFLAAAILVALIFVLFKALPPVLAVLLSFILSIPVIFWTVLCSLTSIYSKRLIVLHNLSAFDSWKRSLRLAKSHFIPTLVMGFFDSIAGCAVGCLVSIGAGFIVLVVGLIVLIPVFFGSGFTPLIGVALAILALIYLNLQTIVAAGLIVFSSSVWNMFVSQIIQDESDL